jgi:hypothetical protein
MENAARAVHDTETCCNFTDFLRGDKIIRPISTSEREKKRTKVMLKMHL